MREHAQVDHRRARARLDDAPEDEEDAASARTPSERGELQPQCSPSVSATISEISPPESSSAPGTSTRDGERIGDSGT